MSNMDFAEHAVRHPVVKVQRASSNVSFPRLEGRALTPVKQATV